MKMFKNLSVLVLVQSCLLLSAPLSYKQPLKVLRTTESDDCYIVFVEDTAKKQLVLKQIKNTDPNEQFLLVVDALAGALAQPFQIPVNNIALINYQADIAGKVLRDMPATLHAMAPGSAMANATTRYKAAIDIQQLCTSENTWALKKYGQLPEEKVGLTRNVINSMASHDDLARIVAFDTFIGNSDRSALNLFYDTKTNAFNGIDMADAFNHNLCKEGMRQLKSVISNKANPLTITEIKALEVYLEVLNDLVTAYPAEKICALLDGFAEQAGFKVGSPLWNEEVCERIYHHKRVIKEGYADAKKLVVLLDKFLADSAKLIKNSKKTEPSKAQK